MCNEAAETCPWTLEHVPDNLKMQEMCDETVCGGPWNMRYIPDWFVTQQQIKIWHDNAYYCNDDSLIRWYEGHLKRKAQKEKLKEELVPFAWHPSLWWDWCMCLLLGIHHVGGIGACQKTKRGIQNNCGHKHGLFCIWWPNTKNFLTKKNYK